MKTLKNHLILFDAECPMCGLYTRAFVSSGMLDKQSRLAYQHLSAEACPMVDRQRAVNEIALVNRETGEVTYGVRSLFKIIATALPFFKPLFSFSPFIWLMSRVYAFISFNRRVIIPAAVANYKFDVQPTFRLNYRLLYLLFTWFFTSCILSEYSKLMIGLVPEGAAWREYVVCGGQIFFQGLIISFINPRKRWDYLGNMMTISLGGALLLLPIVIISSWTNLAPVFCATWFFGVAGLMLLEHIRRSRLLAIGNYMTLSWVLYRLVVLIILLY